MKRRLICFAAVIASLACASCIKEEVDFVSDKYIGVSVNCDNARTKSPEDGDMAVLSQIIEFDKGIVVEEIVSDGIESGFEQVADTKGTVTTTNNIGYEDRKGPKYFGMTGFIRNMDDLDAQYASTPNPYVSYGIAGRVSGKPTDWYLTNHTDQSHYPWLWNLQYDFWSYAPVDVANGALLWGADQVLPEYRHDVVTSFPEAADGSHKSMVINDYVIYRGNESDRVSTDKTYNDSEFQHDLIVAYSTRWYKDGNREGKVKVTFKHALAAVRFNVEGVTNLKVKSVSLDGICYSGTCTVTTEDDGANLDFAWVNNSTKVKFWQSFVDSDFEYGLQKIGGDKILFMLPQTLSGAKLGVTFEYGDGSTTYIEKDINTVWEAGKTYTYNIVFEGDDNWEYFLEPIGDVSISYEGGTDSRDVICYRQHKTEGTMQKVPWHLEYYTGSNWTDAYVSAQPTINSMLAVDKVTGDGAVPAGPFDNINLTIKSVTARPFTGQDAEITHKTVLQSRQPKVDYDLSHFNPATGQETELRNTANCYVVSAPGTYRFPLVYGNGIKNDSPYTSVLSPDKSTTYDISNPDPRKSFVGHDDLPITDPYIFNSLASPTEPLNAVIVWEDAPGLVTNVSTLAGPTQASFKDDYVTFDVPYDNIRQGNCVIAIEQSGHIYWSWHIWVTDEDLSATQRLYDDSDPYDFMPFHLGWVSCGNVSGTAYDGRATRMRVVAEQGGLSKEFLVEEVGHVDVGTSTLGYCPFYQWGRKDPLVPGTGRDNNNHAIYNSAGQISASTVTGWMHNNVGPATIGKSISQPHLFYGFGSGHGDMSIPSIAYGDGSYTWYATNGDDWCEGHFYNYSTNRQVSYSLDHSNTYKGVGFANLWSLNSSKLELSKYPLEHGNKTTDSESYAQYSAPVVKTIYDPCPVGFSVPGVYAFMAFKNGTRFNSAVNGAEKTLSDGSVFFIPATGYRAWDNGNLTGSNDIGNIIYYGNSANLWTATSNTRQRASYTSIGTGAGQTEVDFSNSVFFKTVGSCVRPVKE